jgi:hypothetical protein
MAFARLRQTLFDLKWIPAGQFALNKKSLTFLPAIPCPLPRALINE